jgi:quercetin dioxygenase-like cupin family protein
MMKGSIVKVSEVNPEAFGTVSRWFLISPKVGNSTYQRMAYLEGKPGTKGTLHTHPGDEVLFTISGRANVKIDGEDHFLSPGEAISIPPGTQHYPEVVGNQTWIAVAAYCDDCPIIAQAKK